MISPSPVLLIVPNAGPAGGTTAIPTIELASDSVPASTVGVIVGSFQYLFDPIGGIWGRAESASAESDSLAPTAIGNERVIAQLFGWNGASFDRIRIANVFKTVVATEAGATALWTPAAGKSFRLMGYTISVAGTLAATGVQTLQLLDGATAIKNHLANVIETTTVSISGGDTQIGADLGQGELSAAANNVLSINLGSAMATGGVAVNAWGTEE
jgi:hypothetical protein